MKVTINKKPFDVADEPKDYWGWVSNGNYDREWLVYDMMLKPEHTFIDVGAWIGSHSLYASTVAKGVYALEPDPVAFAILEQNVKGKPIHICQGAIAGHIGEITIGSSWLGASTTRMNLNEGGGIGAATPEHTVSVPCTTLRQFVGDMPSGFEIKDVNSPLFIKIDVEGAEEEILKDVAFFAEHKPSLLIELHPWWWTNPAETQANLQKVRDLYRHQQEVTHNTWMFAEPK